MMGNEIQIIIKAVDKASAELKKVNSGLGSLKSVAIGVGSAVGVMAAAVGAGVAAWKGTVEPLINYNKAVLDASRATRMGVEDLSRFIQVGDDMAVSMDSITRALQLATKNGFAPSITSIADLADKANAMSTPTERAAMLAKILGRNWAELDPILQLGGQRIRELAAAQADGLVATEAEIEKTEVLRTKVDELNDRWTAWKNNLALGVSTVIVDELDAMDAATARSELRRRAYQDLIDQGIRPSVAAVSAHVVEMAREAAQLDVTASAAGHATREVGFLANAIASAQSRSVTVTAVGVRKGDQAVLDFFLGGVIGGGHYGVTETMAARRDVSASSQAARAAAAAAGQAQANKAGVDTSKGRGAASGADFVVPPGYPNDSYPMRVQSGERVQITPAGEKSGASVSITVNSTPMDVQWITKQLKQAVGM